MDANVTRPLPVDCIYLSKLWACDQIKYASEKPAFKYRCPKTLDSVCNCKHQKPRSEAAV